MRRYSDGIFIARFGTSRRMPKSALEAQKSKVLQFQICSRTERKTLINQCQGINQKSKFVRKSFFQNFCRKTLHGARKRAYMLTKLLLKSSRGGRVYFSEIKNFLNEKSPSVRKPVLRCCYTLYIFVWSNNKNQAIRVVVVLRYSSYPITTEIV